MTLQSSTSVIILLMHLFEMIPKLGSGTSVCWSVSFVMCCVQHFVIVICAKQLELCRVCVTLASSNRRSRHILIAPTKQSLVLVSQFSSVFSVKLL